MPPSFARARRRPHEQTASTAVGTHCTSYECLFCLCILHFCHFSSESHVNFMLSSIHWLMASMLMVFTSTKSKSPVRTLAPTTSAAVTLQTVSGYGNFTDCDPLVAVHTFDHNTTTTSSVRLFAAVPVNAYCVPVFCIISLFQQ